MGGEKGAAHRSGSFWWRDLLNITHNSFDDPIGECSRFSVNNGFNTSFWHAKWIGDFSLRILFPDMYEVSNLKHVSVAAMGGWSDGGWSWGDFGLAGSDFTDGVEELRDLVGGAEGMSEGRDDVEWHYKDDMDFSVASCYSFLMKSHIPFGPPNKDDEAFGILWKLEVPFKIKAFGWRLFLNRLPTKDLLLLRGIPLPLDNIFCSFCSNDIEKCRHTFFICDVVKKIWNEIASWVGLGNRMEDECLSSFMEWHSFFKLKKVKRCKLGVVWLAITWCLWIVRNDVCFRNDGWSVNNIVWNIKFTACRWSFCGNITDTNCNFYDFCKDPLCFLS
ncbi:uncharacterized protein LOC131649541 [Vicia villosa]|uniref:uncharacterized protein LOC131649541 n=1 Tax=Vicia villosa TaxID=3911 RepID=UPI00273B5FE1|nr:uncharacterized protein LOC131649541 [Vicia villosa]